MRLPIILSAMIAAMAIPNSIASEATEEKTETAAPEAEPAAAPEAAKSEAKAKPTHKMKHRKHHRHGRSARGHTPDGYDLAYDNPNFPRGNDGSGCSAEPVSQGKIMPPEVPGQKGPMVPAGE
jgi:hypothetical protein